MNLFLALPSLSMELRLSEPQDCVGDFTYDFYWQHKGKRLRPEDRIPSQQGTSFSYKDVVEALKSGRTVRIRGDVGKRLGASMGVSLRYFGGTGGEIAETGSIVVDGNAGSYLGMSMLAGAIYVKGSVEEPLGNVVQVHSDMKGYKKFVSISWLLHHRGEGELCEPNEFVGNTLILRDGILRSTVAARCNTDAKVRICGDTGLSVGILMRRGRIIVEGSAGMNAGALLRGGEIVILGNAEEFVGVKMSAGRIFVRGSCKGYVGANMRGGSIICKSGTKAIPPVREMPLSAEDFKLLAEFGISGILALTYRKYGVR
mgnify:CR=1 FL=1